MTKNNYNSKNDQINEDVETTDQAVDQIVKSEADELLDAKDAELKQLPEQGHKMKRFWHWVITHKKITIPLAVVLVLAVLAAIPFTRYAIAGLFIKQNFSVEVTDSQSGRPVSEATVLIGGQEVFTNGQGYAEVRVPVGRKDLKISKIYYQDFSQEVLVPLTSPDTLKVSLTATGRTVPVSVVNGISKKALADVRLEASDAKVSTDAQGKAIIVVPADQQTLPVTVSAEGYNTQQATLQVTAEEVPENSFSLTPTGKVYFLSNQSGKIDLVKTNLDGTERQVVVAGTGNEDPNTTNLTASRDWRYLALKSRRDGGEYSKLFLIDTSNDKMTVIDEGAADFQTYGWSNDRFIYQVDRHDVDPWLPKKYAIKSFNPADGHIAFLYESNSQGEPNSYQSENLLSVSIVMDEVVYLKAPMQSDGNELVAIKNDGSNSRVLYEPVQQQILYNPEQIRFTLSNDNDDLFSYIPGGNVQAVEGKTSQDLYSNYRQYVLSPDSKKTIWEESRDGKNVLISGNISGDDPRTVATIDQFSPFGWFTNEYIILSKEGRQLYIMAAGSQVDDESQLIKISDYFNHTFYSGM